MTSKRLLVSFSGGETSALMAKLIKERWTDRYNEIIYAMANTSEENRQTFKFARQCEAAFRIDLVYLEAVVNPEAGIGTSFRVVRFDDLAMDGSVFEDVIKKYGIPGPGFPHCTRELKGNPIRAYCRSIGWEAGSYDTAIGIRVDEFDRQAPNAAELRLIYPLIKPWPHRKIDVNDFWFKQPFRLELKGYQGNCKWCWKKSLRKHLTIMAENPGAFDFPERMEAKYPKAGANPKNEDKRFFRNRLTVTDIRRLAAEGKFEPAEDDARVYQTDLLQGFDLDVGGGCEESCEVDFGEAA